MRPTTFPDRARRFLRTPKGLLTIVFALLVVPAAWVEGPARVAPGLAGAVVAAMLLDAPILRWRGGAWEFPSGALLTGVIVAMVSSPREAWYVPATAAAIGVAAKYVVRTRSANVFNPAALGLVATYYLFGAGQNWWGALPEAPLAVGLPLLLATGVFITDRVNKMPLVLAFLGVFYALFTATAYLGDARRVAEIFIAPDLHAALFFALFILTDPPTSPVKYGDQVACGALVAVAAYAVFQGIGAVYYVLAAVLVGNVFEAWRRSRARGGRIAAG